MRERGRTKIVKGGEKAVRKREPKVGLEELRELANDGWVGGRRDCEWR